MLRTSIMVATFLVLATSGTSASKYHKNKCKENFKNVTHHSVYLSMRKDESYDTCECGKTFYTGAGDFIINGREVKDVTKYPFVTLLMDKSYHWMGCGGAIISPTFVITAAHCVYINFNNNPNCITHLTSQCYFGPEDIIIGVFSEKSTVWPSTFIEVENVIPHPDYSRINHPNDMALIKLKKPIECKIYARPICISDKEIVGLGQNILIAGYGATERRNYSPVLKEGIMKRIDKYFCGKLNIVCAVADPQSTCSGDSGTVSFIQRQNRYFAVGVLSTGDCRIASFTRISSFYQFIIQYVKDLPNH